MKNLNHVIGNAIVITEDVKGILESHSARFHYAKYNEDYIKNRFGLDGGQFLVYLSDASSNDSDGWRVVGNYSTELECLQAVREWRNAIRQQCAIKMSDKRWSSTSYYPLWYKIC